MSPQSQPSSLDLSVDRTAGPIAILREAVSLLTRAPGVFVAFAVAALVTVASTNLGNVASVLAQAVAVSVAYGALGGEADGGNSYGVRLLLAFLGALVAGIAILLGGLLLVLPGIYLLVRLRLVVAAVMLEDCGPLAALGRSLELTSSHTLTVLGVWLVPLLAYLAVAVAAVVGTGTISLGGGLDPATVQSTARLVAAGSTLVVSPVAAAADVVMYGLWGPDDAGGSGRADGRDTGEPWDDDPWDDADPTDAGGDARSTDAGDSRSTGGWD